MVPKQSEMKMDREHKQGKEKSVLKVERFLVTNSAEIRFLQLIINVDTCSYMRRQEMHRIKFNHVDIIL